MSGVAGIVYWDGRLVEPGAIEGMTAAMQHRGPDGITHWRQGPVALGQCMLRTTPESLEETLPLANGDGSLVLVMDGRVDNAPELRHELLGRGAVLRSRADAELVLRAYEAWGEDCVRHIVGECVFFVWDARRQALFASRDAAGTRHFYYHCGPGWCAFASDIRGLLALPEVERRINDFRVLDYLVPAFDRTDQVDTFVADVFRLPAGHSMRFTARGVDNWRWWHPAELEPQRFASMDECAEAFMAQLQEVVLPRLRGLRPVGAMLSGGLDSSTLVGLISHRMRDALDQPLHTVSLIRDDRENCLDWQSIQTVLTSDPWLRPTVLTTDKVDEVWPQILSAAAQSHDPFAIANGLTYHLAYQAAGEAGCGVLLDGMAGDLLFHDMSGTMEAVVRRRLWDRLPDLWQTFRNHDFGRSPARELALMAARVHVPGALRGMWRRRGDARRMTQGDLAGVDRELAQAYLRARRSPAYLDGMATWQVNEQADHAARFTSGLNSFGHETYGPLAFACGVEPRSPYSDRRLIEFAIRMPLQAKLAMPRYKHLLRMGTKGLLPDATRLRRDIGSHPGWSYYCRLALRALEDNSAGSSSVSLISAVHRWRQPATQRRRLVDADEERYGRLCDRLLVAWLETRGLL